MQTKLNNSGNYNYNIFLAKIPVEVLNYFRESKIEFEVVTSIQDKNEHLTFKYDDSLQSETNLNSLFVAIDRSKELFISSCLVFRAVRTASDKLEFYLVQDPEGKIKLIPC